MNKQLGQTNSRKFVFYEFIKILNTIIKYFTIQLVNPQNNCSKIHNIILW